MVKAPTKSSICSEMYISKNYSRVSFLHICPNFANNESPIGSVKQKIPEQTCETKNPQYAFQSHCPVSKLWWINCDRISTHVSGTPGRHQCMQSWPQIATASFFPNQIAGWASALNSLKWVKSSNWISVPCKTSIISWFRCLASLFTPSLLGSNHKSSCQE